MSDPVEVVRSLMTGSTAVAAIIGTRAFRADGVTSATTRPYAQLTLTADEPDYDLDGTVNDSTATITIDVVVDSTAAGAALLISAIPTLRGVLAVTVPTAVNGVNVFSIVTQSANDDPNGPADSQGQTAFVRSLTVQITYS